MISQITLSLAFLISLISHTHSQCSTGGVSATKSDGPITLTATLCSTDDKVYIDITYTQYNNNWFAICFPSNPSSNGMVGTAMAYSTGKTTPTLSASVYAYDITAANGNGVSNPIENIWTEVSNNINGNTAQLSYSTPLTNVPFDLNTKSIRFSYATGSANTLALAYHNNRVSSRVNTDLILQFPTDDPTSAPTRTSTDPTTTPSQSPTTETTAPSKFPTKSPNNDPTMSPTNNPSITPTNIPTTTPTASPVQPQYQICAQAELVTGIKLEIGRKISDNTMSITITGPQEKWIAFGFGKTVMKDSYAITAGKLDVNDNSVEIREYILPISSSAVSSGLGTPLSATSTVETNEVVGGVRTVTITRAYMVENVFDFTDFLTCQIDELDIISAEGAAINLAYHSQRVEGKLMRLDSCTCETNIVTTEVEVGGGAYKVFNELYVIGILCIGLYLVV